MFFFIAFFCFSCFLFNFCTTAYFFVLLVTQALTGQATSQAVTKANRFCICPSVFNHLCKHFFCFVQHRYQQFFLFFLQVFPINISKKQCKPFCQSFSLHFFSEVYTITDKIVSFVTFFHSCRYKQRKSELQVRSFFISSFSF